MVSLENCCCVDLTHLKTQVVLHVYGDLGAHPLHLSAYHVYVVKQEEELALGICSTSKKRMDWYRKLQDCCACIVFSAYLSYMLCAL